MSLAEQFEILKKYFQEKKEHEPIGLNPVPDCKLTGPELQALVISEEININR